MKTEMNIEINAKAAPIYTIQRIDMDIDGSKVALLSAVLLSGTVIGTVQLIINEDVSDFSRLFVIPAYRRYGVGRALINKCTREMDGRSKAIACAVNPKNTEAMNFYFAIGFLVSYKFQDGDFLLTRWVRAGDDSINYKYLAEVRGGVIQFFKEKVERLETEARQSDSCSLVKNKDVWVWQEPSKEFDKIKEVRCSHILIKTDEVRSLVERVSILEKALERNAEELVSSVNFRANVKKLLG